MSPRLVRGSVAIMTSACLAARRRLSRPDTAMPVARAASARTSCNRSVSRRLSLAFERLRHDSQVLTAESLIDDLSPFVGQAGEHGEVVAAGGLEGEVH